MSRCKMEYTVARQTDERHAFKRGSVAAEECGRAPGSRPALEESPQEMRLEKGSMALRSLLWLGLLAQFESQHLEAGVHVCEASLVYTELQNSQSFVERYCLTQQQRACHDERCIISHIQQRDLELRNKMYLGGEGIFLIAVWRKVFFKGTIRKIDSAV